ncbi:MAG TPA: hypothetical protein DCW90_09940 [Lachnospiraceae bacterium]|nr:hypothetical protein [Lachnospiraceae bacterium]
MEIILKLLKENPDAAISLVHEYIEKYKPIVYGLGNECLKIAKDYVENDELHQLCATAKRKTFLAYTSVGFTEDQALALMLNDNLQLMKNLKQVSVSANSTKTAKSRV